MLAGRARQCDRRLPQRDDVLLSYSFLAANQRTDRRLRKKRNGAGYK